MSLNSHEFEFTLNSKTFCGGTLRWQFATIQGKWRDYTCTVCVLILTGMLNFGVEFDEVVLRVKWWFQVSSPNGAGSCEELKIYHVTLFCLCMRRR